MTSIRDNFSYELIHKASGSSDLFNWVGTVFSSMEEQEKESKDVFESACGIREPSGLSNRVKRLRQSALRVIGSRERLPHPLFWSLFYSEISALRKSKLKERQLQEFLDNV